MKLKYASVPQYREFISVSQLYKNSRIQFKIDGSDLKARYSIPIIDNYDNDKNKFNTDETMLNVYSNIILNKKLCPQYSGLILQSTQLNNVDTIQDAVEMLKPNLNQVRSKFLNENKDLLIERKSRMQSFTTITTTSSTFNIKNRLLTILKDSTKSNREVQQPVSTPLTRLIFTDEMQKSKLKQPIIYNSVLKRREKFQQHR